MHTLEQLPSMNDAQNHGNIVSYIIDLDVLEDCDELGSLLAWKETRRRSGIHGVGVR